MKKQIAAVLLVLAAVLLSGCAEQMSADQIAARMEAKQPDKTRSEFIEPAEFAGTVMVRNGSTMWMYDPVKNQVTKMELPDMGDEPFEMDYTSIVKDLMDENDISYKGTENVGGRSAYVIEATPKDESKRKFISKTRVWIDRENWMMIGTEMYDADGNPMVKVEYRDITFNTGIPDSEFIFEVPEGAEVVEESFEDRMPEKMTLEEASANLTFDLTTPSYLPEGYEFDHAMVIGGEREVVSLQYTNGDERLHLSEWISDDMEQSGLRMGEPEIVSINGTDGEFTSMFGMNTLQWSADGIDYSLSGGLEKDELVNVAESIQ